MNPVLRLLAAVMGAAVLLSILSLTLLNKHSPNMRMRALMRDARAATLMEDHGEAAEIYRLAVALNRRNARPYLLLSEAYISNRDFEDALFFLRMGMRETGNEQVRAAYNGLLGRLAADDPNGNGYAEFDLRSD
jgi:thioredoxin-like negative regulator of GroEL